MRISQTLPFAILFSLLSTGCSQVTFVGYDKVYDTGFEEEIVEPNSVEEETHHAHVTATPAYTDHEVDDSSTGEPDEPREPIIRDWDIYLFGGIYEFAEEGGSSGYIECDAVIPATGQDFHLTPEIDEDGFAVVCSDGPIILIHDIEIELMHLLSPRQEVSGSFAVSVYDMDGTFSTEYAEGEIVHVIEDDYLAWVQINGEYQTFINWQLIPWHLE